MWQQIESNKRKTFYTLITMSLFLVLFGLCCSIIITSDIIEIIIINIIFYIIVIGMFIYAYKKPLSSFGNNIYKYTGQEDRTLLDIVSEMKIASGLSKMPEIYILDSNILNAFACGTNEKNAKVVVSKGLLKTLNRDELQGVIGHEIAHIVNKDTCYLLYASIIVNIVANFASFYLRSMTGSRRSSNSSGSNPIGIIIAIIFMILAPILAQMFYFFLSRKREYLADACSAQFTRYPEGLASALRKISGEIQKDSNSETAKDLKELSSPLASASYIVPLKLTSEGDGLFSTHPSTKNRINILLKMANKTRADLSAYNSAYEEITKNKGLIKLTNQEQKKISIRQAFLEPDNVENMSANINSQAIGLLGAGAAQAVEFNSDIQEAENIEETVKHHRNVENMMWNLANYTTLDCPCGTRLRVPKSYKGKTIVCPHCKKEHAIT